MKFSSYNPTVSPNVMRNVPVEASRDLNVYGGRSGGEMWKAFGSIAKMGLDIQQDVVDGKVLEANAEYNRRMSEGTSELMQRKEGAALNITDDYDNLQKKVYAEVQEKYGNYLFGKARDTFNAYTAKDDATRRSGVVKYQAGQAEAFAETQYNNQLAECRATAIENGGTIENVAEGLNRMDAVVEMRYGSYGGEKVVEQKRLAAGKIVGDAVSMAIDTGDFGKAEALVNRYKDLLPTNAYIDARSKIQKQQEIKNQYLTIDAISNRFRGADGKIDLARGYAEIDRICGPDAVRRVGGGAGLGDVRGYNMPTQGENISAQVAELKAGWNSALPKIGGILKDKFGVDAVISSAGRSEEHNAEVGGAANSYHIVRENGGDAVDIVLDDDLTQQQADAIKEYFDSTGAFDEVLFHDVGSGYHLHLGGLNDSGDMGGGEQVVSAFDPEKYEKLRRMLKAQYDSENALSKQNESAAYDQLLSDMKNCETYAEAYDMAINSGQPMDKVNRAVNVARAYFGVKPDGTPRGGSASGGDGGVDWKAIDKAKKLVRVMDVNLAAGKNPTAEQWVAMKDAADAIVDSGMLTEEQVAELSDVYGFMGFVADYIDEGHSIPETYKWLLDSDTSPDIAFIAISNLNRNYRAVGKAVPHNEEDEETGG